MNDKRVKKLRKLLRATLPKDTISVKYNDKVMKTFVDDKDRVIAMSITRYLTKDCFRGMYQHAKHNLV